MSNIPVACVRNAAKASCTGAFTGDYNWDSWRLGPCQADGTTRVWWLVLFYYYQHCFASPYRTPDSYWHQPLQVCQVGSGSKSDQESLHGCRSMEAKMSSRLYNSILYYAYWSSWILGTIVLAVLQRFDYVFSENGLVAYKAGELQAVQSISSHMGEEKLKEFINFALKYLAGDCFYSWHCCP